MYLVLSYVASVTILMAGFLWIAHFFTNAKGPERFARKVRLWMLAFLMVALICMAVRELFA